MTRQDTLTTDVLFVALTTMRGEDLERLLSGDRARAAPMVRAAAEYGLPAGQLRFGRMLLEGEGVERDPASAFTWFMRAADGDDRDAMNMVGRCLENGWGTPVDLVGAARWYSRAAEAGSDWAQYNLGHLYLEGRGVAQDHREALRWYLEAAQQGHPRAMNLAARCYEEGWGAPIDRAAAREWYRKSAEGGYFRGQYNFATTLLAEGRRDEARQWLHQAAESEPLAMFTAVGEMLKVNGPSLWDGLGRAIFALCAEKCSPGC